MKLYPPRSDGLIPHVPTMEEMKNCFYAEKFGAIRCPSLDKKGNVREGTNCSSCIFRSIIVPSNITSVRQHALARKT